MTAILAFTLLGDLSDVMTWPLPRLLIICAYAANPISLAKATEHIKAFMAQNGCIVVSFSYSSEG